MWVLAGLARVGGPEDVAAYDKISLQPVGKAGEFTWLDEAGNDTHMLVGT